MSYRRILKSTFIMGGSSIFNTLLGIVRTKVVAVILGPTGVGLAGIYVTVSNLVSTLSGMGIGESGVRQIAGAHGTGDEAIVARTIVTIRRVALLSGVAGMSILLFFSSSISRLTFGSSLHAHDLALISVMILFGAVSGGQTALIQGMRRIGDLAKLSMLGSLMGTFLSIPIIYVWGEKGIPYFLLSVSATSILTSWWYSRKIKVPAVKMRWRDTFSDASPLLRLGLALMAGALMTVGTQYLLRVFVIRYLGLSAAGVYQASTTLSFVYVGVILNAMVTDFYPRLSAAAGDNRECASLMNKQIEVGLLLAVPGILAIITFAPYVIATFYSSKFILAVDILRWQILGVLLQVVTWPMGFILRAKGDGKFFFWTELFANGTHLSLAWLAITTFGLPGIGMAFLGMNITYFLLIFRIVRSHYEFSFSGANMRMMTMAALITGTVFLTRHFLSTNMSLLVNTGITVAVSAYSLRSLVSISEVQSPLVKIKSFFSFNHAG